MRNQSVTVEFRLPQILIIFENSYNVYYCLYHLIQLISQVLVKPDMLNMVRMNKKASVLQGYRNLE